MVNKDEYIIVLIFFAETLADDVICKRNGKLWFRSWLKIENCYCTGAGLVRKHRATTWIYIEPGSQRDG